MLLIGKFASQARYVCHIKQMAMKMQGEKKLRLTPLLYFLPYYLISNFCPIPDNASGFAQELWISNTR
jgi:hypothetical protein